MVETGTRVDPELEASEVEPKHSSHGSEDTSFWLHFQCNEKKDVRETPLITGIKASLC